MKKIYLLLAFFASIDLAFGTDFGIKFTAGVGYVSEDMITCYDNVESYNGLEIEFNLTCEGMPEDELELISDRSTYSIYRTAMSWSGSSITENVTKTLRPNKHTVNNFNIHLNKLMFKCVIVTENGERVERTLTLELYPYQMNIDAVNLVSKDTYSKSIDYDKNIIYAMCPKGEEFKIKYYLADAIRPNIAAYESKIEYTCPEYPDMVPYEDVVPFVPYPEMVPYPEYVAPDFDSMNLITLHQYIDDKGWSFEDDNMGQSLDDATASQIRGYLKVKDKLVYDADKLTYEQQYEADKLAYEQQYEADKQAYIDDYNAKKAEFEAGCEQKQQWLPFNDPDNYTAIFEYIPTIESATFFIRTRNYNGCYSEPIKIEIDYYDRIIGNTIAFVDDKYKGKNEVWVSEGEGNPLIQGSIVSGGYGIPKDNKDCTYTYVWKFYDKENDSWYEINYFDGEEGRICEYVENGISGVRPNPEESFISLSAEIIDNISKMYPEGVEIARFVYSMSGNDLNIIEDKSNILKINGARSLSVEQFNSDIDEEYCPGDGKIKIVFSELNLNENEILDVSCNYEGFEAIIDYNKKIINIYNASSNIYVNITCIDTLNNVRSKTLQKYVRVPEFYADFSMYVEGKEYSRYHYPYIKQGSRVVLENKSICEIEGDIVYNWTLQVQKNNFKGQSSTKENPVCYLYNPGENVILLEVITSNNCRSQVVMNSVYVDQVDERSISIDSYFEENKGQVLDVESFVSVYPTILVDDYIVNIESNIEQYNIVLTDAAGKVILTKEDMSMSSMLELAHLPRGIYILQAANKTFKLIKK